MLLEELSTFDDEPNIELLEVELVLEVEVEVVSVVNNPNGSNIDDENIPKKLD